MINVSKHSGGEARQFNCSSVSLNSKKIKGKKSGFYDLPGKCFGYYYYFCIVWSVSRDLNKGLSGYKIIELKTSNPFYLHCAVLTLMLWAWMSQWLPQRLLWLQWQVTSQLQGTKYGVEVYNLYMFPLSQNKKVFC